MVVANDTAITIRINSGVKERAQALFSDLGLDMSTAVNIFLRQAVREERIPFTISRDEPSRETYKVIEDTLSDKNMVGPFKTAREVMESLDADD